MVLLAVGFDPYFHSSSGSHMMFITSTSSIIQTCFLFVNTPVTKPLRQPKSHNHTGFEVVLSCTRSPLSSKQKIIVVLRLMAGKPVK